MKKSLHHRALSLAALTLLSVACSNSKGPVVPAKVPAGTGTQQIQMNGRWLIQNVTVVEASSASVAPPLANTEIVIENGAVMSIGGFTVARTQLEAFLGFPLDFYINAANGLTVLYGLGYDRLSQSGSREQVGLAGGSVDADTISVESFSSVRPNSQSDEMFIRSRYTLARVTAPVLLDGAARDLPADEAQAAAVPLSDAAQAQRALALLFGRAVPLEPR